MRYSHYQCVRGTGGWGWSQFQRQPKKQCALFHYVVLCPEANKWRLAAKEVICFVLNWLSKEAEARASIHSYI
jgi:hypothetical protein